MSIFPCISISMGQDNDDKKIMLIYWTNQPKLCYCLSAKTRHLECNKRDGSLIWFFPRGCWFFLCLFTSLTNRIMYHNFHERYKNKNKIYHLTFQKIFFYTSPFFFFFLFVFKGELNMLSDRNTMLYFLINPATVGLEWMDHQLLWS